MDFSNQTRDTLDQFFCSITILKETYKKNINLLKPCSTPKWCRCVMSSSTMLSSTRFQLFIFLTHIAYGHMCIQALWQNNKTQPKTNLSFQTQMKLEVILKGLLAHQVKLILNSTLTQMHHSYEHQGDLKLYSAKYFAQTMSSFIYIDFSLFCSIPTRRWKTCQNQSKNASASKNLKPSSKSSQTLIDKRVRPNAGTAKQPFECYFMPTTPAHREYPMAFARTVTDLLEDLKSNAKGKPSIPTGGAPPALFTMTRLEWNTVGELWSFADFDILISSMCICGSRNDFESQWPNGVATCHSCTIVNRIIPAGAVATRHTYF